MSLAETLREQHRLRHAKWAAISVPDTGIDLHRDKPQAILPRQKRLEAFFPEVAKRAFYRSQRWTFARIVEVVAEHYQLSESEITARNQSKLSSRARHMAFYLAHTTLGYNYTKIARKCGGKHHTTIMSGVNNVAAAARSSEGLRDLISELKNKVTDGRAKAGPILSEPAPRGPRWSDDDISILREIAASGLEREYASRKLGRSKSAINNKVRALGLVWAANEEVRYV